MTRRQLFGMTIGAILAPVMAKKLKLPRLVLTKSDGTRVDAFTHKRIFPLNFRGWDSHQAHVMAHYRHLQYLLNKHRGHMETFGELEKRRARR